MTPETFLSMIEANRTRPPGPDRDTILALCAFVTELLAGREIIRPRPAVAKSDVERLGRVITALEIEARTYYDGHCSGDPIIDKNWCDVEMHKRWLVLYGHCQFLKRFVKYAKTAEIAGCEA